MTALPARTGTGGITDAATTKGTQKNNLGDMRDYLAALFGTDGTIDTALRTARLLDVDAALNYSLSFASASNVLTATLKGRDGNALSAANPAFFSMRNATIGSGDFNLRGVTGAITLAFSSGSTMGCANNDSRYIYFYVIEANPSTLELAASANYFGRSGLTTTTAEGGAGGADSGNVMYSTAGHSTLPFRCIGRIKAPQTTAGTWAALPSSIELPPFDVWAGVSRTARNLAARTNASTPNTKLDISADEIALKDANGNVMIAGSVAVTIDFGTTGANGLDAGTQASSTFYYGHVIGKPDGTVAGLGSLSATAPTLPSGYTFSALATAARSNGSTQFVPYRQMGNEIFHETPVSALAGGAATAETSVSLSAIIPPIAQKVQVMMNSNSAVTARLRVITAKDILVMGISGDRAVVNVPNVGQALLYIHDAGGGSLTLNIQSYTIPVGGQ